MGYEQVLVSFHTIGQEIVLSGPEFKAKLHRTTLNKEFVYMERNPMLLAGFCEHQDDGGRDR
jgi:hypothetical protein